MWFHPVETTCHQSFIKKKIKLSASSTEECELMIPVVHSAHPSQSTAFPCVACRFLLQIQVSSTPKARQLKIIFIGQYEFVYNNHQQYTKRNWSAVQILKIKLNHLLQKWMAYQKAIFNSDCIISLYAENSYKKILQTWCYIPLLWTHIKFVTVSSWCVQKFMASKIWGALIAYLSMRKYILSPLSSF